MPSTRAPPDPFTTQSQPHAPRRPTSRTTHLEDTTAAHGFRSTAHTVRSTASSAPSRNLFASALSRRPTSSTNASTVHEDNSSGDENELISVRTTRRGPQTRRRARDRVRGGSVAEEEEEEGKERKEMREVERDVVVRDEKGSYVEEIPPFGGDMEPTAAEERQRIMGDEDARLTSITRNFWATGAGIAGRGSRKIDEEELVPQSADVMARLREAVVDKLEEEEWMYEPTDYMQSLLVKTHGRM